MLIIGVLAAMFVPAAATAKAPPDGRYGVYSGQGVGVTVKHGRVTGAFFLCYVPNEAGGPHRYNQEFVYRGKLRISSKGKFSSTSEWHSKKTYGKVLNPPPAYNVPLSVTMKGKFVGKKFTLSLAFNGPTVCDPIKPNHGHWSGKY